MCTILALLVLNACAADYQPAKGFGGGYTEREVSPERWIVTYRGNGFSTKDTVLAYWMYRSAAISLDHGYQGFRVAGGFPPIITTTAIAPPHEVAAAGGATMIFVPSGPPRPVYQITGTIILLRDPLPRNRPGVFNAARVKEGLDPVVFGRKCSDNNVCPHDTSYLDLDP